MFAINQSFSMNTAERKNSYTTKKLTYDEFSGKDILVENF